MRDLMEIVPIICTVLCDVYVEILEYPGKAKSPIMRYLTEPVSHLCIPTPPMPLMMAWTCTSQNTCCMVSWPQGTETSSPTSLQRRLQAWYEGPKMDYTNWEYLADNISAWKQELSSRPPPPRGTRPQRNLWRETQEKERVLAVKCASDWWFCFTCQGCNRHCKSRTGLYIHTRRCPSVDSMGATSIIWQDWQMPMMMHYNECHSYIAIELHLFHTPNIF